MTTQSHQEFMANWDRQVGCRDQYDPAASEAVWSALMISGAYDKQVAPDRVRELYADLGSREELFVDLACSSHNAAREKNYLLLFRASLEWLMQGSVKGARDGTVELGY